MALREIGCEGVDWIHVAQDRDRWWAQHGNGPKGSIKGEFLD